MKGNLKSYTSRVVDAITRRCFQALEEMLSDEEILKFNFVKIEAALPTATNLKIPHSLGFQPTDIIVTRQTGVGALTWNYELFTDKLLDVTTTGPVDFRALVGAYRENFE